MSNQNFLRENVLNESLCSIQDIHYLKSSFQSFSPKNKKNILVSDQGKVFRIKTRKVDSGIESSK